jgi:hypothetical protein
MITQVFGDTETSQSVNLYKASMVISGEIPGARSTCISTSAAVLSVTFLILIFPASFAFTMLSIRPVVVTPYGTLLISKFFYQIHRYVPALLPVRRASPGYSRQHLPWHRLENRDRDQIFFLSGI